MVQPATEVAASRLTGVMKAGRKGRNGQGRDSSVELQGKMGWAT